MYSIRAWRFPVGYLFSVVLSKSMCISTLRPSSSPFSSLVILFIHLALWFLFYFFFFLVTIFSSEIVRFLWHPVVGMFSCYPLPIADRIFCCFGMFCCVCIVLPFVDISLISLLSPVLSGLFTQVVLFFSRIAFSFLFPHISASFFCFIIFACFRCFFYLGL